MPRNYERVREDDDSDAESQGSTYSGRGRRSGSSRPSGVKISWESLAQWACIGLLGAGVTFCTVAGALYLDERLNRPAGFAAPVSASPSSSALFGDLDSAQRFRINGVMGVRDPVGFAGMDAPSTQRKRGPQATAEPTLERIALLSVPVRSDGQLVTDKAIVGTNAKKIIAALTAENETLLEKVQAVWDRISTEVKDRGVHEAVHLPGFGNVIVLIEEDRLDADVDGYRNWVRIAAFTDVDQSDLAHSAACASNYASFCTRDLDTKAACHKLEDLAGKFAYAGGLAMSEADALAAFAKDAQSWKDGRYTAHLVRSKARTDDMRDVLASTDASKDDDYKPTSNDEPRILSDPLVLETLQALEVCGREVWHALADHDTATTNLVTPKMAYATQLTDNRALVLIHDAPRPIGVSKCNHSDRYECGRNACTWEPFPCHGHESCHVVQTNGTRVETVHVPAEHKTIVKDAVNLIECPLAIAPFATQTPVAIPAVPPSTTPTSASGYAGYVKLEYLAANGKDLLASALGECVLKQTNQTTPGTPAFVPGSGASDFVVFFDSDHPVPSTPVEDYTVGVNTTGTCTFDKDDLTSGKPQYCGSGDFADNLAVYCEADDSPSPTYVCRGIDDLVHVTLVSATEDTTAGTVALKVTLTETADCGPFLGFRSEGSNGAATAGPSTTATNINGPDDYTRFAFHVCEFGKRAQTKVVGAPSTKAVESTTSSHKGPAYRIKHADELDDRCVPGSAYARALELPKAITWANASNVEDKGVILVEPDHRHAIFAEALSAAQTSDDMLKHYLMFCSGQSDSSILYVLVDDKYNNTATKATAVTQQTATNTRNAFYAALKTVYDAFEQDSLAPGEFATTRKVDNVVYEDRGFSAMWATAFTPTYDILAGTATNPVTVVDGDTATTGRPRCVVGVPVYGIW